MNQQEDLEDAWKARLILEKMGDKLDYEKINDAKNCLDKILAKLWLRRNGCK